MRPRELVQGWVEAFNRGNAEEVTAFYHEDAVNHQVTQDPVEGRAAIQAMFAREFAAADMVCIVENIFEDGDVAILEWRDPLGLRGCGFFHVKDGKIVFQRGYWDKLSFVRLHGLPIEQGDSPACPGGAIGHDMSIVCPTGVCFGSRAGARLEPCEGLHWMDSGRRLSAAVRITPSSPPARQPRADRRTRRAAGAARAQGPRCRCRSRSRPAPRPGPRS